MYDEPPLNILTNPSAPNPLPTWLSKPLQLLSFTTLAFLIIPPYTTFLIVQYYLLGGPPRKSWTLGDFLACRLIGSLVTTKMFWGLPSVASNAAKILNQKRYAKKGLEVEMKWIQPVSEKRRVGFLKCEYVKGVEVPGFMVWPTAASSNGPSMGSSFQKAKPGEKVILYLVGGGMVQGHPLEYATIWTISSITSQRILGLNYRKAVNSGSAFPAPLIDALAGYLYLTEELGFEPKNVTFMGDSAGGNIALGLARYLGEMKWRVKNGKEGGEDLGMCGRMILFSPWCDMTHSSPTFATNSISDYVSGFGRLNVPSHTRHYNFSIPPSHPYFSPGLRLADNKPRFTHLIENGVRVYVQVGTAEALEGEIRWLVEGMKEEGVEVVFRELIDDFHDGIIFGRKKATEAAKKDLPEFFS